jgi:methylated-DNA-protein-cysteine methyltransferase-like protein
MSGIKERIYEIVASIPEGSVMNYGRVAQFAGNSRASRVVGFVLHSNKDPVKYPCHRVVFKDGSLSTGFGMGGIEVQRERLLKEGISFLPDGRVDMKKHAI